MQKHKRKSNARCRDWKVKDENEREWHENLHILDRTSLECKR
jgi:hypothetical protein